MDNRAPAVGPQHLSKPQSQRMPIAAVTVIARNSPPRCRAASPLDHGNLYGWRRVVVGGGSQP